MKGTPCKVVHGQSDVAYPLELSKKVVDALKQSGVDAELEQIPGATHYACVTAPEQ